MREESKVTVWYMNGVMDAGGTESLIMNIFRYRSDLVKYILVIHGAKEQGTAMHDNEIKQLGIEIYYLPAVGEGIKEYSIKFNELVEKIGKPDIIHSHLNGVGGVISKIAKKSGIENRIVHCHADIKFRGSRISNIKNEIKLGFMKALVNKYANFFFACSNNAAKRLFYKSDKATIVNNMITVEDYLCNKDKWEIEREKIGITEDTIVIGSIGRISRIKNYELIIKAISKLKQKGKKIIFICYGRVVDKKYYEELIILSKEVGVDRDIYFKGNSQNVSNDIASFDIFVMPSFTEGFGMAALEAQASGKKMILSTGVPKEVDMNLGLVEFVEPNDIDGLAYKIESFIKEDYKYKDIKSEDIIKRFKERGFNAKDEVTKIEKIYLDMVGVSYEY